MESYSLKKILVIHYIISNSFILSANFKLAASHFMKKFLVQWLATLKLEC